MVRVCMVVLLAFSLAACSSMAFRVGPLGVGVAGNAKEGTASIALSGPDGAPFWDATSHVWTPNVVKSTWAWLEKVLPKLGFSILSSAVTPTGPVSAPSDETPTESPPQP